jgi:phenylalanyl-tRNA synthetase beta chain
MKLFELSDVVCLDAADETGAMNQRKLAAVFCGLTSGFEVVHGLLDQLMWALGFVHETEMHNLTGSQAKVCKGTYLLRNAEDATFLAGRQAEVVVRVKPQAGSKLDDGVELVVGNLGVLHPEVMANYEIPFVVSAMEVNIQPFLRVLNGLSPL